MGPQGDTSESFGQYLRRERELREIKLEEIAAYTRIKPRALLAIEQDDFASLPPIAFVRAFVRCYADYIGLSIPEVMLRFDGFIQSRYPELTGEVPIIKGSRAPRQPYFIVLLVAVVILLAVLAWWMSREPLKTPGAIGAPNPTPGTILGSTDGNLPPTADVLMLPGGRPPTVTDASTADGSTVLPDSGETVRPSPDDGTTLAVGLTPAAGSTAADIAQAEVFTTPGATASAVGSPTTAALPPGIKHLVVIAVRADCWIGYTLDGAKKGELTLRPGQSIKLEAGQQVRLIVGNPNAISSLTINGQPLAFTPRCSPQYLAFPAGPDDRSCYPRPVVRPRARTAAPTTRPGATAPARPSTPQ